MSDEAFIHSVVPDGGTKIAAEQDPIGQSSAVEVSSYQMNWLSQPIDQPLAIVGPGPA
jgi:polar amino acid transport system substrate-binding protein